MSEREGTPQEIAAALFGGGSSKPDNRAIVDAAHPPDPPAEGDGLTSNQARAGTEYGLPNAIAARLQGEGYDEISADAQTLVDALAGQAEANVPAHVKLARAAIEAARNNPNRAELQALSRVKPDHAAISALLEEEGEAE